MSFQEIDYTLILFISFCVVFTIQLWYYLGIFSRLAFYKKKAVSSVKPPVSVVIAARNEDDNLIEHLPLILNQNYPDFEVVVVNDCSYDNTNDVLEEFARKYDNLKFTTIKESDNHQTGKKFALLVGIKKAQHENLLLTDADCRPSSPDWITHMASNFIDKTEIVLGYGAYEKKKSFLNKLIRFDTFYVALQYLSFALAGKTYMGVGRNLSYKKSLFFKMKGFGSHYHIESGDDDLFVNEAATKLNSKIEVNLDSFTISKVKTTFQGWVRQKRRHITTGKYYNFKSKLRLGILSVSQYLFFMLLVTLLILQVQLYIVGAIFLFRLLIQLLIFKKSMKRLEEKDLFFLAPILELFLLFFYPFLLLSNLFIKKNKWKR